MEKQKVTKANTREVTISKELELKMQLLANLIIDKILITNFADLPLKPDKSSIDLHREVSYDQRK